MFRQIERPREDELPTTAGSPQTTATPKKRAKLRQAISIHKYRSVEQLRRTTRPSPLLDNRRLQCRSTTSGNSQGSSTNTASRQNLQSNCYPRLLGLQRGYPKADYSTKARCCTKARCSTRSKLSYYSKACASAKARWPPSSIETTQQLSFST